MCGICGFIGNFNGLNYSFEGLEMLLNRGYDSVGCCSFTDDLSNFKVTKYCTVGNQLSIDSLRNNLHKHNNTNICIMHSRWSVVGEVSNNNAHPINCYRNKFSVVHNGILENYQIIKKYLIKNGVEFKTQTDTEVIINLISFNHKLLVENDVNSDHDQLIKNAIEKSLITMEGTWGLVIMSTCAPDYLFCTRQGSPLLIGIDSNNQFAMIASEESGFCNHLKQYICLKDHNVVTLQNSKDGIVFDSTHTYVERPISDYQKELENSKNTYPHWLLKEIMEQPDASLRTIGMGSRIINDKQVRLGGLEGYADQLINTDHIILLGCGTSYYSCLYSSYYFKNLCNFDSVQAIDGSEFTEQDIPKNRKSIAIMVSQSGETKDLRDCLEICKNASILTIGIINVVDSDIARDVLCGVYLNAGKENSVASTKAFTCQVIALSMIAVWFSQHADINATKRIKLIQDIRMFHHDMKNTINLVNSKCKDISNILLNCNSAFIIGKGTSQYIAKEASLKLKEVAYMHTEGFSSSSLKHGPYSLLTNGYPVFMIIPNDSNFVKNMSIAEQLKTRKAFIIGISDVDLDDKFNIKIKIPQNQSFFPVLSIVIFQLISYYIALLKGHSPDYLRNLSKTITV